MPRETDLYLCDILDAIKKIQEYTSGFTYNDFTSNRMCIDAVIKNLLIIGEAVKKIPDEIKSRHTPIDWKNISGLRDILIHTYFRIDDEIICDIIQNELKDLENEVLKISD
jgi:uncharacterized protein with HEPN domain